MSLVIQSALFGNAMVMEYQWVDDTKMNYRTHRPKPGMMVNVCEYSWGALSQYNRTFQIGFTQIHGDLHARRIPNTGWMTIIGPIGFHLPLIYHGTFEDLSN